MYIYGIRPIGSLKNVYKVCMWELVVVLTPLYKFLAIPHTISRMNYSCQTLSNRIIGSIIRLHITSTSRITKKMEKYC